MKKIQITEEKGTLKYLQLTNAIIDAINSGQIGEGEMLPSVSDLMKDANLSRDTVFKAYKELKSRNIVESVPNRGYFVAKKTNKVLLLLDTFKAYKEVLYDTFIQALPDNVTVELNFHHYNIETLRSVVNESIGKYSKYIVMPFEHESTEEILSIIPKEKLLMLDWDTIQGSGYSSVCQDFGMGLYRGLSEGMPKFFNFKRFVFVYPKELTYHPPVSIEYFKRFCVDHQMPFEIVYSKSDINTQYGDLYLLVSDRTLAEVLDQTSSRGQSVGTEVGIISYNETPMKKYINNGITVVSTDFKKMGEVAAEFVTNGKCIQTVISTTLKSRQSF